MKKGQAAMEFLMSYGWAILTVLVVIGALAYFGVFSTSKFKAYGCNFGLGFSCSDAKAQTDQLRFSIKNNLGNDLEYFYITFSGDIEGCDLTDLQPDYPGHTATCGIPDTNCYYIYNKGSGSYTGPVRTGTTATILEFKDGVDCSFNSEAFVDYKIIYRAVGDNLNHNITGSFSLKVN